ncbi:hypothetical protein [Paraburkholderia atlantica]|uniref:hypothetical protein n=1 Tax=Paraburkholderia atlantica TaxID=2654982 RepID=UPI0012FF3D17|nr:hypothetical protein [Paraburkholderia atlantica]MBB5510741.1 hypothetical protein [Paraburkholderia atlantica]
MNVSPTHFFKSSVRAIDIPHLFAPKLKSNCTLAVARPTFGFEIDFGIFGKSRSKADDVLAERSRSRAKLRL